ncbi:hypothetical protein SUGI_0288490 [Cryptomeria japonica]|uniref:uncharacterized protein LOC131057066 n=1 Tax=Cryptomeria japonica TaxID=3369 RepID=UPI002408A017|nr:uncharacterized protein LOC131057066 [Cryptomeria japonica]GLJ16758.1 hypothetical protein SUGI_0288490 [Cryptomeria japonica]
MSSYGGGGGDGEESWEVVHPPHSFSPAYDDEGLEIDSGGLIDPNYFAHPERIPLPTAVEREEEEELMSPVQSSPEWVDPGTPRDAEEESVDESRSSEEEGLVVEEVEDRVLEGIAESNSGPVEPYCSFTEWWRAPVDVWKTKVSHVGTLWSIAMVAAVMGFVILGRRWYRVRSQNKKLGIQVNADDKRITQLMFQAVRLNEAFYAVRRIPVVKAQSLGFPLRAGRYSRLWVGAE